MKRGYLLPDGCKDLMDVLRRTASPLSPAGLVYQLDAAAVKSQLWKLMGKQPLQAAQLMDILMKLKPQVLKLKPKPPQQSPDPLPLIVGEMVIPDQTPVSQLAALLGQKPSQVIADVMKLGFFVTAEEPLSFEIISRVARKHGYIARRTD